MTDIFDVARQADVSVTTVSRVLNNHPSVRPRTRRLVLQTMEELGYRPNSFARGFRKARSGTIGLVIRDLTNAVHVGLIAGVEGVVRERGYSLLLSDSGGQRETESANLRDMFERRVEALILSSLAEPPPELALFQRAEVPFIGIALDEWSPSVPHLGAQPGEALQAMAQYLRQLGHERIGLVVARFLPYRSRTGAIGKLLQELGIGLDRSLVVAPSSEVECLSAVTALLAKPDRPTALISTRHAFSPFVLGGIQAAGLRIPDDISLVVFGDSPWAQFHSPPITAISQDYVKLGHAAASYVFAKLAGQDGQEYLQETKPEFIIRESCAAAPNARVQ